MRYEEAKEKEVDIFTHSKLQEAKAIKKLTMALSRPLQEHFCFASVRDDKTLIFYFSHPLHVKEFRLQKEEIKAKMRHIYKKESLKEVLFFKDCDAALKPYEVKQKEADTSCPYAERSRGTFTNNCTGALGEAFEVLRETIKKRIK